MNPLVCNYAVLRFLPYRETGEFVNVGVLLFCPQVGYFGFECEPRWRRRLRAFFPELDKEVFRTGIKALRTEMNRVSRFFTRGEAGGERLEESLALFRDLTQPREGLFYFAANGVLLAPKPEDALRQLYDQFVLRRFAQSVEYQETVMRQRLNGWLRAWDLRRFYTTDQKVGNDRFHATFPFVYGTQEYAKKALKPLDLDRRDATDIYQHADHWLNAMRRLAKIGKLPGQTVFPVRLPATGLRREAADEVVRELTGQGAVVLPLEEGQTLRDAVSIPLDPAGQPL